MHAACVKHHIHHSQHVQAMSSSIRMKEDCKYHHIMLLFDHWIERTPSWCWWNTHIHIIYVAFTIHHTHHEAHVKQASNHTVTWMIHSCVPSWSITYRHTLVTKDSQQNIPCVGWTMEPHSIHIRGWTSMVTSVQLMSYSCVIQQWSNTCE